MDPSDSPTDLTVIEPTTGPGDPGSSGSQPCDLEKIPSTLQVDSFFNFLELVVFQVYFTFFIAWNHPSPLEQVGDTLFQVIRNGFEIPGTIFEALFSLPPANKNGTPVEGTSLDNPIILEGVIEKQFRAFLRALYPL